MATPSSTYGSMISARSRRLRTVGSVLLVAIIAMVLYGTLSLMPSLRRSSSETRVAARRSIEARTPKEKAELKVVAAKVIFAYAYWTFCGVLILSAVFVAYLDFREVSRNYLTQRLAIWKDETTQSRGEDEG
jgi:hypothetical protein